MDYTVWIVGYLIIGIVVAFFSFRIFPDNMLKSIQYGKVYKIEEEDMLKAVFLRVIFWFMPVIMLFSIWLAEFFSFLNSETRNLGFINKFLHKKLIAQKGSDE